MPEEKGKNGYGRFLRLGLALTDLALVNILFLILATIHPDIIAHYTKLKWVMLSASYLPVVITTFDSRIDRSIHIDRLLTRGIQAVGIHALFFISLLSFLGVDDLSARVYLEFYGLMLLCLPASWVLERMILKRIRHHGINYSKVIIVGTNASARRLFSSLTADSGYGYHVLAFFDKAGSPATIDQTQVLPLTSLESFIRSHAVDELFFVLSGENEDDLLSVIKTTDDTMVKFHFVPKITPYVGRRFTLSSIGGLPVLTPLTNPLSNPVNRLIKRATDLLISSTFLILSPIVFIPVAIAVKLSSPGPIFFRQKRTGYRGREFDCLKFRTMRVNADSDAIQATATDPRKTRVGDFLRRTSIDELPQFINVWRGDMSVVGPRPHMLAHTRQYSELVDRYMIRHMVKPGITGWAQVCGFRGNTDELWKMSGRVERDVWYIEHWSFMLDIKIIIKTIVNALKGEKNAY